jgi:hypothetical protein
MPHSRISIAGTLCSRFRNFAAPGGETQPQKNEVVRLRHAAPHSSYVALPSPSQVRRCVARGSRRRWYMEFPLLQGDGNRVPPRIGNHS